jgi:hypothetical protein
MFVTAMTATPTHPQQTALGPDGNDSGHQGRLVQRLLRWTPTAAALVAATLLSINGFRTDRPPGDRTLADIDPPTADNWAARQRTDRKYEVVVDLFTERLTNAEAHARFLDLNRADPKALAYLRELPGETDEDRTAYQLFLFVRAYPHPLAKEVAAAVGRELLGRELPPGRPTAADRKRVPDPQ